MANLRVRETPTSPWIDLSLDTKDYVRQGGYAVSSGTGSTYDVTTSPAPTAYVDGMSIAFKANKNSPSGGSSLNWNGLGARALRDSKGNPIILNKLINGVIYSWRYNASNSSFILQGEGGDYGTAIASDVLAGKTIGTDNGLVTGTMPNRAGDKSTVLMTSNITNVTFPAPDGGGYFGQLRHKVGVTGYVDANTTEVTQNVYGLHPSVIKEGQIIGASGSQIVGTFKGGVYLRHEGGNSGTGNTFVRVCRAVPQYTGKISIHFIFKPLHGSYDVEARIKRNGVIIHEVTTLQMFDRQFDFRDIDCVAGDVFELEQRGTGSASRAEMKDILIASIASPFGGTITS